MVDKILAFLYTQGKWINRHCCCASNFAVYPSPNPCRTFMDFIDLTRNPVEGFSAGLVDENNIYEWEVMIMGPSETLFEGGVFRARLSFPYNYPLMPPTLRFVSEMWHPNVYPDGTVCISILHEPGEDKYGYERPEERWLPVHTVETIMLSVISMLSSPNLESPANPDAARDLRDTPELFKKKVQRIVRTSQEM